MNKENNKLRKYLENYLLSIKEDFDFEGLKLIGEGTQKAADYTEDYWRLTTLNHLKDDDLLIVKAGSQQYPDFLMINTKHILSSKDSDFINEYNMRVKKGKSLHNFLKEKAEQSEELKKHLVKVEIKSSKANTYQCNDSLPNPSENTIYVFFSQKEAKVYINTSKQMAKAQGESEYKFLVEKYNSDMEQKKEWRTIKKAEWANFGINSTPRMTYTINNNYAHVDQTLDIMNELIGILEEAELIS